MFTVVKTFYVSCCHSLDLDYPSPCQQQHGHNYKITVYCRSKELDHNGMVEDFSKIKSKIKNEIDHKNLDNILSDNPTAEVLAFWIYEQIEKCFKVEVEESPGNVAIYEEI